MRVSRFAIALLSICGVFCVAEDSAHKAQPFAENPLISETSSPSAGIFTHPAQTSESRELKFTLPDRSLHVPNVKSRTLAPDETCFSMRSYVVEREQPGSDSVTPKEYSTCQPSSKFDLKRAVAPVSEPSLK